MCTELKPYFEVLPPSRRNFASLARHLRNCDYKEYNEFGMLVGKLYFTVDVFVGEEKSQYIIAAFDVSDQKFADNRTFNADHVSSESIKTLIHFNTTTELFQKSGKAFMNETVMRYAMDLVVEEQVRVCATFVENEDLKGISAA